QSPVSHPSLHFFPTRRSSDLRRSAHAASPRLTLSSTLFLFFFFPSPRVRHRSIVVTTETEMSVPRENKKMNSCHIPFALNIPGIDRKSTRLNSSHVKISYAVF